MVNVVCVVVFVKFVIFLNVPNSKHYAQIFFWPTNFSALDPLKPNGFG